MNDAQICLKLSGPLREALAADAAARGRSVSNLIRKILIEHYAERAPRELARDAAGERAN